MKSISTYGQFCFLIGFLFSNCTSETATLQKEKQVEVFATNLYGGTGGISVDKQGNVYSSDFGPFLGAVKDLLPHCKIFKITPAGEVSIFADSLKGASGSDFDAAGNLYQSNIISKVITKISPTGEKSTFASDSLFSPVGVIVNEENELVVCNCGNNTLRKISPTGESRLFVKSDLLKCPNGITSDEEGNFYVANFNDGKIIKITPQGEPSVWTEVPGNNNGHLKYHKGFVYVVARTAQQIYKVAPDGIIELFAGSGKRGRANGDRLSASFNFPNDLDFSPDGTYMYVNEEADTLSDPRILTPTVVRKIRME